MDNYEISNKHMAVRLNTFNKDYASNLLMYNDRVKYANTLLTYLCKRFKISLPQLFICNEPRPKKKSGTTHGYYKRIGYNNSRSASCIVIYNLTSVQKKEISILSFYDTLIHEFMHHYDYEVLKLKDSKHTSGFYKRISDLKDKLKKI